jgi:hypothetical protein
MKNKKILQTYSCLFLLKMNQSHAMFSDFYFKSIYTFWLEIIMLNLDII